MVTQCDVYLQNSLCTFDVNRVLFVSTGRRFKFGNYIALNKVGILEK
jgi:hypothetical protein